MLAKVYVYAFLSCLALRLVNTRTMVSPVSKDSHIMADESEFPKLDMSVDLDRKLPRKRSRTNLESTSKHMNRFDSYI